MEPHIFVHPGWIRSRSDGDSHFIGFSQLCHLYKLNPCTAINADVDSQMLGIYLCEGDKHYYPRYDGDYEKGAENG